MNITIIKYNAGNIRSVLFALERLGIQANLSDDPEEIRKADKVIFPGVGEASTTMKYLRNAGLDRLIPDLQQPVLGICLGMQLMCEYSEENKTSCLGIFPEHVRLFRPDSDNIKVPHMGWNALSDMQGILWEDLPTDPYVYFVHSYYVEQGPDTAAITQYVQPFSAAMQRDNFYATQFHPEKSGRVGSKILQNFVEKG